MPLVEQATLPEGMRGARRIFRARREIWGKVWPREVPLARDIDLDALATRFTLTGGSIRNIAIASAFLAAADGAEVTMRHVLRAVRREYEKVGKTVSQVELNAALEPEIAR